MLKTEFIDNFVPIKEKKKVDWVKYYEKRLRAQNNRIKLLLILTLVFAGVGLKLFHDISDLKIQVETLELAQPTPDFTEPPVIKEDLSSFDLPVEPTVKLTQSQKAELRR